MYKLFPILFLLILTSCSKPEIPSHRLIENGGIFYERDSNEPFTGSSVNHIDTKLFSKTYLENGIIVKKETFHPNGKLHTVENFNEGEEGSKVQVFDEEGTDISDETYLTYWGNGLVKVRGHYINGKRDGLWEEFDSMGNSVRRNHWRDNKLLPIIDFEKIQLRENIPFLANSREPFSGIIRFKESPYKGVRLQEFKDGKPEGFVEWRHEEEKGGHIAYYASYTKGPSYNFETKYIEGTKPYYKEGLFYHWFDENGNKQVEGSVQDGLQLYTRYHESGAIKGKGQSRFYPEDGWYEDGVQIVYYENGQLRSEELYDKGVPVSGKKFSDSGMDISNGEGLGYEDTSYYPQQGYYLNGLRDGKWEDERGAFNTYQKGILEGPSVYKTDSECTWMVGSYKKGLREGEWIEYTYGNCMEDGDPSELTYFENGEEVER